MLRGNILCTRVLGHVEGWRVAFMCAQSTVQMTQDRAHGNTLQLLLQLPGESFLHPSPQVLAPAGNRQRHKEAWKCSQLCPGIPSGGPAWVKKQSMGKDLGTKMPITGWFRRMKVKHPDPTVGGGFFFLPAWNNGRASLGSPGSSL